jgi:hypothetical protein
LKLFVVATFGVLRMRLNALALACASASALFLLAACTTPGGKEPLGAPAKEEIVAVSVSNHLLRFNAGQPQQVRDRKPLQGLRAGERLVGIDFRVAKGELYALGATGQLYRIDVSKASAEPIGSPAALPTEGKAWAFNFNPVADRLRVANDAGHNLRLHPDTGAVVDGDPNTPGVQHDGRLHYDAADVSAGKPARVVAAAYTYNKTDSKLTTNYALDGALGTLAHQGTKEGVQPVVSFNTGRLYTVGKLGIGSFSYATFDIADTSPTAYAGVRNEGERATRWYGVDLASGQAKFIGSVGGGEALVGAAIEP